MKVLTINDQYEPWTRGGAEAVAASIAAIWREHGHRSEVLVLRPRSADAPSERGITAWRSSWYDAIAGRGLRALAVKLYLWLSPITAWRAWRQIRKSGYDLVITHNILGFGLFLPRLLSARRIKHVHFLHDTQLFYSSGLMLWGSEAKADRPLWRLYAAITRIVWGSPDLVVSPSAWLAAEHRKRGFFANSEVVIWPNPTDHITRTRSGAEASKRQGEYRFLFLGQIEEHKGVELLIRSFLAVKANTGRDLALTIAGEGSLRQTLAASYRQPSLEWLGWVERSDLAALFARADCLVIPSLCYENSPLVIMEAFSHGVPVIGSDLGGISELLAAGRGRTFKPGQADSLREAMESFAAAGAPSPEALAQTKMFIESSYWENCWKRWQAWLDRS